MTERMSSAGPGPENGVWWCGCVGGNPGGFLVLESQYQCQEASGLKGERERNDIGRKSLLLCPGRATLSVGAGSHIIQQAYRECRTSADSVSGREE